MIEYVIGKVDDIACFVANWEDKGTNIRTIAQKLNLGTDALVFFDDNPAERELVRRFVPEVTVVEVPPDPAVLVRALTASTARSRAMRSLMLNATPFADARSDARSK